jgi:hypothetical protein
MDYQVTPAQHVKCSLSAQQVQHTASQWLAANALNIGLWGLALSSLRLAEKRKGEGAVSLQGLFTVAVRSMA